ncbi:MAG: tRNA 2-thiouridine(34) synthase MnmA, partial [Candidatus Marinimicrobia bacterium]|nr:tRNA 2-thiouridine(34) synthase MnmA [Candidatus Neomarinimicrobiota bacterium]
KLTPLISGKIVVNFLITADSVTPGQSAVFYDGDRVLGGGIIEEALER